MAVVPYAGLDTAGIDTTTAVFKHGPDELGAVALALSGRSRKALDWRTPAEALNDHFLASAPSPP